MSEKGNIETRLEHYAKMAMPHYPYDLCSDAKREIASLRAQLAEEKAKHALTIQHSDQIERWLASARKALDAANEYFEDAAIIKSDYTRRVVQTFKEAYASLSDEEGKS